MPSRFDLGPKPRLGYVDSLIDRAAAFRADKGAMERHADDPKSGYYVVGGELIVTRRHGEHGEPLFARADAEALGEPHERVFLGFCGGLAQFGLAIAADVAEALKARDDLLVTDLRSIAVQGLVDSVHLAPLAEAKALLLWHARHRFCSVCGSASRVADGGWRRDCPACGAQHFPRTDPCVIMLAVKGERCLLGRSPRFGAGMWSCLAGFVEPGESVEDAVRRETMEEAGVVCGQVAYFRSQPWPFPMSLMIGCHAEALTDSITMDESELDGARWFERGEVAAMLARRHPDGLYTPPPSAIAHHIIRAFVDGEAPGF
ncbi:NAD(+) diphosphatase [Xanthobacteraceae bacterium Astr-EGSB]|uniref:NAD(+) diphosphatase n=1 Tax=Astrobacterium formosum TaxID=3069710 RepID=UPI0027ADA4E8|nr:NAD(+) diphosphatase [Xanthobacteraceae bacterium Astr-EGSB]